VLAARGLTTPSVFRHLEASLHELAEDLPEAAGESQFEAGLNALLRGVKARKP
jgi:hypothetical protein